MTDVSLFVRAREKVLPLFSISPYFTLALCSHFSVVSGHMIPHATHGFEGSGLPENTPYFLTLGGYMLIFFVEKIAFDAHHIMHDGVGVGGDGHNHGSADVKDGKNLAISSASGRSATILLLALGVHALMETMALGLSSSKLSAGLLATSIGLHQVRQPDERNCDFVLFYRHVDAQTLCLFVPGRIIYRSHGYSALRLFEWLAVCLFCPFEVWTILLARSPKSLLSCRDKSNM